MVLLWEAEVLRHVGTLTRLTGLWVNYGGRYMPEPMHAHFALLAALTFLKALSVRNGPNMRNAPTVFAMVQSEELGSRVLRPMGSDLGAILLAAGCPAAYCCVQFLSQQFRMRAEIPRVGEWSPTAPPSVLGLP